MRKFTKDDLNIRHMTPETIAVELERLEARHSMSSADFYTRYNRGELPEDRDNIVWAALYDMAAKASLQGRASA